MQKKTEGNKRRKKCFVCCTSLHSMYVAGTLTLTKRNGIRWCKTKQKRKKRKETKGVENVFDLVCKKNLEFFFWIQVSQSWSRERKGCQLVSNLLNVNEILLHDYKKSFLQQFDQLFLCTYTLYISFQVEIYCSFLSLL